MQILRLVLGYSKVSPVKKVVVFSILLVVGIAGSQFMPSLLGDAYEQIVHVIRFLTMVALGFIMIHVGYEFELDRRNLRQYGWDYVVAMTAAAFPWLLAAAYFTFVMLPSSNWGNWDAWKETLLAGRFAAPTSAGVLFSMLAAAGLSATWLFRKARILAIFDDVDTVLLMVPLKILMVGLAWQLGIVVLVMAALLILGWRYLHRLSIPVTWPWVLSYAASITIVSELVYFGSKWIDAGVPIHIEVLLPAFVLGCMMTRPAGTDPHTDDAREGHQEGPESPEEQRAASRIAACFMVLVGLSMPPILAATGSSADSNVAASITAGLTMPAWSDIALHVVALTLLCNIGKMFPLFCYRSEATWRERLALCIGMWPRGEVGAGVLILSVSYGIGGPIVTVAMLTLALNLILTGVFILMVERLIQHDSVAAKTSSDAKAFPAVTGKLSKQLS